MQALFQNNCLNFIRSSASMFCFLVGGAFLKRYTFLEKPFSEENKGSIIQPTGINVVSGSTAKGKIAW